MTKRVFSIAVLSLVIGALLIGVGSSPIQNAQAAGAGLGRKHIEVRTLIAQGMPVSVDTAIATRADRNDQSELRLSITNQTAKRLEGMVASLLILDAAGNLVAGEGWSESIDLGGRSNKNLSINLKNRLAQGDRAVLVLHEITGKVKIWTVEINDLASLVKDYDKTGYNSLPAAEMIKRAERVFAADYCKDGLEAAKSTCGTSGVASFSCGTTGYSFTCKEGRPPVQPVAVPEND